MKYLLDTHVLIWWFEDSERLSPLFVEIIENPSNVKYVSVVNLWEVVVKIMTGKLKLKRTLDFIVRNLFEFEILDIKLNHVLEIQNLPKIHKDPFDRMLIAQAKVEGLTLLTADRKVIQYFGK